MADDLIEVTVMCAICQGTGETEGYPGYGPQGGPDGAMYTCFACKGEKTRQAVLAPGSLDEAMMRWARAKMAFGAFNAPGMDLPKGSNAQKLSQLCADAWDTAGAARALWRKEHG